MAIIVLRGVGRVNHPDVPGDYSRRPPYIDDDGQKWTHADVNAWEPPLRDVPVYDPVPAPEEHGQR